MEGAHKAPVVSFTWMQLNIMNAIRSLVLPLFLGLGALPSAGADVLEHTFTVGVDVPQREFFVVAENGWDTRAQHLAYDPARKRLYDPATVRRLQVRTGSYQTLRARLDRDAYISSGLDRIALTIQVGGKDLALASQEIGRFDGGFDGYLDVRIKPDAPPETGYKPGNYAGVVSMTIEFDDPFESAVDPES